MRRGSWLVVAAIALAACGIDVAGIAPANVDGGGGASSSSGGTTGKAPDDGSVVDGADAPFDAAEIVLEGVQNLTAIAIAGPRLVVGRSDLEALTIDVKSRTPGSIPNIKKARALMANGDDVYFVAQLDDNSGNVGHWKADGTNGGGVTHANEPPGRDVFIDGTKLLGSYKDHVVSYNAANVDDIQDRSADHNGTPMGIVGNNTDVYWADDARGAVWKDPIVGGDPPVKFLEGLDHPSSLTIIDGDLYVTTSTTIAKSPLAGAAPAAFVPDLAKPVSLTHDGTTLYWIDANAGRLKRRPTTGADQNVATIGACASFAEWWPKLIDFDATYVYWGSPAEGRVYRRVK